jgi:hypothetical protein
MSWRTVPLASGAHGVARNRPTVFGRARLNWSGDRLRLDLRSTTGTTQQGFNLDGGSLRSRFDFQARVQTVDGGRAVTCPLLFGINDVRSYFTFRLESETDVLPYVNTWNVLTPSQRTKTKLAIAADGSDYRFFVNDREVFEREVDDVPTHTVAVGVTVLANGLRSDAVCHTDSVLLKVDD